MFATRQSAQLASVVRAVRRDMSGRTGFRRVSVAATGVALIAAVALPAGSSTPPTVPVSVQRTILRQDPQYAFVPTVIPVGYLKTLSVSGKYRYYGWNDLKHYGGGVMIHFRWPNYAYLEVLLPPSLDNWLPATTTSTGPSDWLASQRIRPATRA